MRSSRCKWDEGPTRSSEVTACHCRQPLQPLTCEYHTIWPVGFNGGMKSLQVKSCEGSKSSDTFSSSELPNNPQGLGLQVKWDNMTAK